MIGQQKWGGRTNTDTITIIIELIYTVGSKFRPMSLVAPLLEVTEVVHAVAAVAAVSAASPSVYERPSSFLCQPRYVKRRIITGYIAPKLLRSR